MTLAEWAAAQPYRLTYHSGMDGAWIPDQPRLVDRTKAWRLSDYIVSGVHGGTIWLMKRS